MAVATARTAQLPRSAPSDAAEPPSEPEGRGARVAARQSVSVATAMRELFDAADADGNGTLDAEEVASFVQLLRPSREMSAIEVSMAMDAMDLEQSGVVTFKQFERWWMGGGSRTPEERRVYAAQAEKRNPRESVLSIFDMIDIDRGGSLDREEIRKAGTVLGKIFSPEELDQAMKAMDTEKTGEVGFDSFYAWYMTLYMYTSLLPLVDASPRAAIGERI